MTHWRDHEPFAPTMRCLTRPQACETQATYLCDHCGKLRQTTKDEHRRHKAQCEAQAAVQAAQEMVRRV
jgi:hypothetical protein